MKVNLFTFVSLISLVVIKPAAGLQLSLPSLSSLPSMPSLSSLPSVPSLSSLFSGFSSSLPSLHSLKSLTPSISFNWESAQRKAKALYRTVSQTVVEDAALLVPELVKKHGYPCETHRVVSPDGYILTMHRIPHGRSGPSRSRPVVYIHHGILSSSADWLVAGPDKALGYILADAGYDVWLANNRGNRYSRNHTHLDPDSTTFWDFSWHEIGIYDVTTMIDHALNQTKEEKLFYIGHSQRTTVFCVMCSEKSEYNKKIKIMFSMAPIAYMTDVGSPLVKFIAFGLGGIAAVLNSFGVEEFLPRAQILSRVGSVLCGNDSVMQVLCLNSLFAVCGVSEKQLNTTLVPIIMGHPLAGAATKQLLHFAQGINSGFSSSLPSLHSLKSLTPSISFNWESAQRKAKAFYRTVSQTVVEDAALLVPELVKKHGYPCETHRVVSPDGYILTMHRIPHGRSGPSRSRPVVYIHHGILSSSADWLVAGPDKALGYILADAGYDVWLANNRGNRYSRNHTHLDPDSAKFWDFSWHEIGIYDVTTMIDHALNQTKEEKLFYIGHSQGTTVFYVMCSEKPEYNKKIKIMFSMAPIAYMTDVGSPLLKFIAFGHGGIAAVLNSFGVREFLPRTQILSRVGSVLCKNDSVTQVLCLNSLFAVCGFSEKQMNTTLVPIIMGHSPAGAATKQLLHFAQGINSGQFRKWDYGWTGNLEHYDDVEPPSYQINKVKVPVYLFYSRNDWLSGQGDVRKLYTELGNVRDAFVIPDHTFNHVDYLFGIEARAIIYDNIILLMTRH